MKLFICLLLFILSAPVRGQQLLSAEQKKADFLYLHEILAGNYPYFGVYKRQTGLDWLSRKEEYILRLQRTGTDDAYLAELDNILSELGCKYIDISPTRHWDKFRQTYGEISLYNPGYTQWINTLNQSPGKISYWNRLLTGNNIMPVGYNTPTENEQISNCRDNITPDGRIAILRVASFEVKHLEADFHRINNFLNGLDDAEFLIIDLQGNKGGTTQYWMKCLVNRLIELPIDFERNLTMKDGEMNRHFYPFYAANGKILQKNTELPCIPAEFLDGSYLHVRESTMIYPFMHVDFGGSIIVLVDGKTSSAADEFAVFCKSTGWATVVGETSAGSGIGGDPALIQLPQSGIIIRYPALTGFNPDGSLNMETCTTPNVYIEGSNPDERLNNVIKTVKKLTTNSPTI